MAIFIQNYFSFWWTYRGFARGSHCMEYSLDLLFLLFSLSLNLRSAPHIVYICIIRVTVR